MNINHDFWWIRTQNRRFSRHRLRVELKWAVGATCYNNQLFSAREKIKINIVLDFWLFWLFFQSQMVGKIPKKSWKYNGIIFFWVKNTQKRHRKEHYWTFRSRFRNFIFWLNFILFFDLSTPARCHRGGLPNP